MRIQIALLSILLGLLINSHTSAQVYKFDTAHTSISFKVSHFDISWTHGRFNKFAGKFTIDQDVERSSFELTIDVASVDTANQQRDDHLRRADFFDVEKYPEITFKSTSVKRVDNGLEVTGDFTMLGVTKPIVFVLEGGRTAEFPQGTKRIGFTTTLQIKRSDFGMGYMLQAIGDDVFISISFEGVESKE
ncbi:MAG TPA: YceI family protein [Pirellulaceae bacterium]|nr:YceI family protein [Pirellulaceae bacterium]HMO92100.1 YceI family protein [Pirellulaceae bacterium]HMP69312.1 YceI family protein [Pirellulaceae bacterium]